MSRGGWFIYVVRSPLGHSREKKTEGGHRGPRDMGAEVTVVVRGTEGGGVALSDGCGGGEQLVGSMDV